MEDVFYVTDRDYQPLADPDYCRRLQDSICNELDERNREDSTGDPVSKQTLST